MKNKGSPEHLRKFYRRNRKAKSVIRDIKKYDFSNLSDDELRKTKDCLKEKISNMLPSEPGKDDVQNALRKILPELHARAEEVMRRKKQRQEKWTVMNREYEWDMVPYEVQHIGAIALNEGKVAEIGTGEGKTLVAVMPLMLNALAGKSHLVTVNEYLAQRDYEWMKPIYESLGFSVGLNLSIEGMMRLHPGKDPVDAKRDAYSKDILYTTASEVGFDYMRDHMVDSLEKKVMSSMDYAVIDEADHVLIDEAVVPLIISGPKIRDLSSAEDGKYCALADKIVRQVVELHDKAEREFKQELNMKLRPLKNKIKSIDEQLASKLKNRESEAFNRIKKAKNAKDEKNRKRVVEQIIRDTFVCMAVQRAVAKTRKKLYEHRIRETTAKETMIFEDGEMDDSGLRAGGKAYIKHHDLAQVYTFTERGIDKIEELLNEEGIDTKRFWRNESFESLRTDNLECKNLESKDSWPSEDKGYASFHKLLTHIHLALDAYKTLEKNRDYIVDEEKGKIILVSRTSGRILRNRQYSQGMQQALQAKEGLPVEPMRLTMSQITVQSLFRLYKKLAGMTGTAKDAENEFSEIFGMPVFVVPPNKPSIMKRNYDSIYCSENAKFMAIAKDVKERVRKGQPVLIGTQTEEASEKLSKVFEEQGIKHEVLNGKRTFRDQKREAEIISKAGRRGAVTIATNMAGRGTDIKVDKSLDSVGGLYVIGAERSTDRRVDRQLEGRTARQGRPGETKFYLSLDDIVLKSGMSEWMIQFLKKVWESDDPYEEIQTRSITKRIKAIQKELGEMHYDMRKKLLEKDMAVGHARESFYSLRDSLMGTNDDFLEAMESLFECFIEQEAKSAATQGELAYNLSNKLTVRIPGSLPMKDLKRHALSLLKSRLEYSLEKAPGFRQAVARMIVNNIDNIWIKYMEHIAEINHTSVFAGLAPGGVFGKFSDPHSLFIYSAKDKFEEFYSALSNHSTQSVFAGSTEIIAKHIISFFLKDRMKNERDKEFVNSEQGIGEEESKRIFELMGYQKEESSTPDKISLMDKLRGYMDINPHIFIGGSEHNYIPIKQGVYDFAYYHKVGDERYENTMKTAENIVLTSAVLPNLHPGRAVKYFDIEQCRSRGTPVFTKKGKKIFGKFFKSHSREVGEVAALLEGFYIITGLK